MSDTEVVEKTEKKRGRPAATTTDSSKMDSKKRSRDISSPKKDKDKVIKESSENGSTAKRGRGRPKGTKKAKKAPIPGRGRGRPKGNIKPKDESAEDSENEEDENESASD